MRCDYCGGRIRVDEENEQEVTIIIDGGRRKNDICNGMVNKRYHCCSYECRVKMFDEVLRAISKEELKREHLEEKTDAMEKTDMIKTTPKKKPPKITVSDIALGLSIFLLLFQIFCHVILPRLT